MPDGQADNSAPETLDDLAAFLVDNPIEGEGEPSRKQRDAATDKGTAKPASKTTASDDDTAEDDAQSAPGANDTEDDTDEAEPEKKPKQAEPEDDDDDAEDDDENRTSEKTYRVTVKGEDGQDEQHTVTLDELTKGYMRQADYSRKTAAGETSRQDFAQRGIAALETQRQRHAEALQVNIRAIQQIAGLRTAEEMQYLANTDPALYTQEAARQHVILGVLNQTHQQISAERAESQRQLKALADQEMAHAWGVLGQKGIDKPKLRAIFDATAKNYGFTEDDFAGVTNPKLVLLMQDAKAYRDLKVKTASVTKQAQAAPPLPKQRQAAPKNERLSKQLDARFNGGRAKMDDLAAYLSLHKF